MQAQPEWWTRSDAIGLFINCPWNWNNCFLVDALRRSTFCWGSSGVFHWTIYSQTLYRRVPVLFPLRRHHLTLEYHHCWSGVDEFHPQTQKRQLWCTGYRIKAAISPLTISPIHSCTSVWQMRWDAWLGVLCGSQATHTGVLAGSLWVAQNQLLALVEFCAQWNPALSPFQGVGGTV